jgi:hypothetical protein
MTSTISTLRTRYLNTVAASVSATAEAPYDDQQIYWPTFRLYVMSTVKGLVNGIVPIKQFILLAAHVAAEAESRARK